MIPHEILKKIKRIEITTSRAVTDIFGGQYHSIFKGKGMEFDEVREYQPGDDIRSIDWNVTARIGAPFVKKFVEERELTVILMLDLSRSLYFGTGNLLKRELAAEICSVLAFSAIKNNDKVGLVAFTDKIEKFIPPRKGPSHVLRIIREALYFKPQGKKTDLALALDHLNKITHRRTITFLLSDFYDSDFKKSLSIANKRHDIVAVSITDPMEINLPDIGIISLRDPESGREFMVDTSGKVSREMFAGNSRRLIENREKLFKTINVDHVDIRTDVPYTRSLLKFFKKRARRLRAR